MGIRIIYGTSKKKNTSVCISEINAVLERNSSENLILLVPEQYSSYYEHMLVEKSLEKGSLRAEILTFKRLAYRVFARSLHGGNKYIDNAGKSMLMYEVVSGISDDFEAFAKAGKYPAFANEAIKTIREFKRYGVTPEALFETAAKTDSKLLREKLNEMSRIYKEYEDKLKSGGFCDADDNMSDLASLININNYYKNDIFWFDGFDGFTPAEMEVLTALMAKTKAMTFSFCCRNLNIPDESDVFYPVVKTAVKIQKVVERLGFYTKESRISADAPELTGVPGELEHLASQYFMYPGEIYNGSVNFIKLHKSDSIFAEVERCAVEISCKVRSGLLRYGDICVVSGLYDEYREYIDAVFSKYNIPVFLDEKRSIAKHPVAAYLLSLLDIYTTKYSYESVFTFLKSDYSEIPDDEISILENYILQWDIKGTGMWTGSDWEFYTDGNDNNEKLKRLNSIRKKITNLLSPLFKKLKYGITADSFIREIFDFLVDNGVFNRIKADAAEAVNDGRLDYSDELKQSWNILMDIFNQIHIISGDKKQTVEKYRIMLELALAQKKIGVIPPRTDAVFAGKINKAYGNNSKMLMILGANDPGFPEKLVNEGLLTDKDRADIRIAGLELAPDTKTQVMNSLINIYNLFNIPDQFLFVSYSVSGPDGSIRRKSAFFDRMTDLFENALEEDISMINPDNYILTPITGLDALSGRGDRSDSLNRWYRENGFPTVTDVPEESIPEIPFENVIKELLGEAIESSPTVIEKYVSCPFKYFAGDALMAKPRKEYEISPPDVGSILHGLLKGLVEKYIGDKDINYENLIAESGAELRKMRYSKIFSRDKRHEYLGERIVRRAVDSFIILKDHVDKGDFKPIELEASFGRNKNISAPRFNTDGHRIYLNGRIDRVDGAIINDEEYFRIIDYKSSYRPLRLYKINEGLDIQLASYLMAYAMHSGTNPAGMYYFTTKKKIVPSNYGFDKDWVAGEILAGGKMEGYTVNNPEVIKAMDSEIIGDSNIIPVKYDIKKGEASKKVLSSEALVSMSERIGEIVVLNTEKIFSCDFKVRPVNADISACAYCNFNRICRFNSRRPEFNYRQVPVVADRDVVWGKNE